MHEIDASFSKQRKARLERKRKRSFRLYLALASTGAVFAALAIALGIWLDAQSVVPTDDDAEELVQQETQAEVIPVYVPTIIDLPGDPIRIEFGSSGGGSNVHFVGVPSSLAAQGVKGPILVLSKNLVENSERLSITLPSTQQDFAFFQSQRTAQQDETGEPAAPAPQDAAEDGGETDEVASNEVQNASPSEPAVPDAEDGGGWGDIDGAGLSGADQSFETTEVENNTTTMTLVSESDRLSVTEDVFVRAVTTIAPENFLLENKINLLDAKVAGEAVKTELGLETLEPGTIVAMRQLRAGNRGADRKLVQVAMYQSEQFPGALALSEDNKFHQAVDPWVGKRLTETVTEKPDKPAPQVRLLDGIFSAGIRNGVAASVVGEAIMYLSREYDLNDLAQPDDRMTLVFSETARTGGESPGRILYVAVEHQGKTNQCFVYKPKGAADFKCLDQFDATEQLEIANGMVTPVAGGVMTSRFGPRMHPILKKVLMHKGVDWAGPVGTPVLAAFDGTVAYAGNGGSYGNLIKLSHPGGRETRYAHLSAFAKTTHAGNPVKAGDVIGYIGTTGRSTGPHLHFELYANGTAIDPLTAGPSGPSGPAVVADSGAVEKLVNRIVHIESGGNARAKNPLSSATGLGQFIDSTWLRMMRTYRPDLANSLSRDKLLALRFDPTLSTEMVTMLARENKAYLESAGHKVTAGRLYLAHFLGPGGANTVLSAGAGADLAALLGEGVIGANPFLRGHDVAFIEAWAERKMSGRAPPPRPVAVVKRTEAVERTSPEYKLFRQALIDIAASG